MSDQGLPPNSSGNGMIPVDGDGGDATCTACGDFHEICDMCGYEMDCDNICADCEPICEECGEYMVECQCDDHESEDDDG